MGNYHFPVTYVQGLGSPWHVAAPRLRAGKRQLVTPVVFWGVQGTESTGGPSVPKNAFILLMHVVEAGLNIWRGLNL